MDTPTYFTVVDPAACLATGARELACSVCHAQGDYSVVLNDCLANTVFCPTHALARGLIREGAKQCYRCSAPVPLAEAERIAAATHAWITAHSWEDAPVDYCEALDLIHCIGTPAEFLHADAPWAGTVVCAACDTHGRAQVDLAALDAATPLMTPAEIAALEAAPEARLPALDTLNAQLARQRATRE